MDIPRSIILKSKQQFSIDTVNKHLFSAYFT